MIGKKRRKDFKRHLGNGRHRWDEMIEISPEKEDVRHADRGIRRAQSTEPYGILLSPLLLPPWLSLQKEDHMHSPPSLLPSTYTRTIISLIWALFFCHVLHCHTGVPAVLIYLAFPPQTHSPSLQVGFTSPSTHHLQALVPLRLHWWLLVPAWPQLPTVDS